MRRSCAVVLCAVVIACAAVASPAAAEPAAPPIATLTAQTPISAGAGWLVWSVPVGARWALEAYHDGAVARVPIASRSQPFDASVGTDSAGAAVAVFSRCSRTPQMDGVGGGDGAGGALVVPSSGSGCRIHAVVLASGRERSLPIPAPPRASDTSPSMWRGAVTFARRAPGHGQVWQVMSWAPRRPRALVTLPHGAIPSYCGGEPCSVRPAHGEVQSLSRNGSIVTFLWSVEGPGVVGEGAWEERIDNLATRTSTLADAGFGHEACTGPVGEGEIESAWPEAPVAAGREALFAQLDAVGYCFKSFAALLNSHSAGAPRSRAGRLAQPVLALAREGSTLYGLVPQLPPPAGADSPTCSSSQPCSLEPISVPALAPQRFTPSPPFV